MRIQTREKTDGGDDGRVEEEVGSGGDEDEEDEERLRRPGCSCERPTGRASRRGQRKRNADTDTQQSTSRSRRSSRPVAPWLTNCSLSISHSHSLALWPVYSTHLKIFFFWLYTLHVLGGVFSSHHNNKSKAFASMENAESERCGSGR